MNDSVSINHSSGKFNPSGLENILPVNSQTQVVEKLEHFSIYSDRLIVLQGIAGSGKSTIIKRLGGLLPKPIEVLKSSCDNRDWLADILSQFGIQSTAAQRSFQFGMAQLNPEKDTVVILDNAELLDIEQVELLVAKVRDDNFHCVLAMDSSARVLKWLNEYPESVIFHETLPLENVESKSLLISMLQESIADPIRLIGQQSIDQMVAQSQGSPAKLKAASEQALQEFNRTNSKRDNRGVSLNKLLVGIGSFILAAILIGVLWFQDQINQQVFNSADPQNNSELLVDNLSGNSLDESRSIENISAENLSVEKHSVENHSMETNSIEYRPSEKVALEDHTLESDATFTLDNSESENEVHSRPVHANSTSDNSQLKSPVDLFDSSILSGENRETQSRDLGNVAKSEVLEPTVSEGAHVKQTSDRITQKADEAADKPSSLSGKPANMDSQTVTGEQTENSDPLAADVATAEVLPEVAPATQFEKHTEDSASTVVEKSSSGEVERQIETHVASASESLSGPLSRQPTDSNNNAVKETAPQETVSIESRLKQVISEAAELRNAETENIEPNSSASRLSTDLQKKSISTSKASRIYGDEKVILSIADTQWLLQIGSFSIAENATAFVEKNQQLGPLLTYRAIRNGKLWYIVSSEAFAERDDALAARDRWISSSSSLKPWLKPVAVIQQEIIQVQALD